MRRTPMKIALVSIFALALGFVALTPCFADSRGAKVEGAKCETAKAEVAKAEVDKAERAKTKAQLQSAYSLLRQGEGYEAKKVLWRARKALKAAGDKVTLRKLERVMVLLQRGDGMAARVRLKSIINS